MIDPVVAWDKLSNFETTEEIREYFQQEDIKGYRGVITACPIANWMQKTTGAEMVRVSGDVAVYNNRCMEERRFEHTDATLQFMRKFDTGSYLELDYNGPGKDRT